MTLQQKLRALGHQLAKAEAYKFNIPSELSFKHKFMLDKYYKNTSAI